jgi:hypothetical protein
LKYSSHIRRILGLCSDVTKLVSIFNREEEGFVTHLYVLYDEIRCEDSGMFVAPAATLGAEDVSDTRNAP